MNKQTAVEWLEKEVNGTFYVAQASEMAKRFKKIFEEAKEMEKEQIMEAAERWKGTNFAEQYYNETYKGGEQ